MTITDADLFDLLDEHTSLSISRNRLDSRDLIQAHDEAQADLDNGEYPELDSELRAIVRIIDNIEHEVNDYSTEWADGVTFIPERDWVEYAQELAEDVGAMPREPDWPQRHIDWKAAADELEQDYTMIEIGGSTYLYRQG